MVSLFYRVLWCLGEIYILWGKTPYPNCHLPSPVECRDGREPAKNEKASLLIFLLLLHDQEYTEFLKQKSKAR